MSRDSDTEYERLYAEANEAADALTIASEREEQARYAHEEADKKIREYVQRLTATARLRAKGEL